MAPEASVPAAEAQQGETELEVVTATPTPETETDPVSSESGPSPVHLEKLMLAYEKGTGFKLTKSAVREVAEFMIGLATENQQLLAAVHHLQGRVQEAEKPSGISRLWKP